MKIIKRNEVIERVIGGKEVYMLVPVGVTTTIEELAEAKGFCVAEVETEKKAEKKPAEPRVDHGKICACYGAGWPISKIADEVGCSEQTVRNHLIKEGIYQGPQLPKKEE